MNRLHVALALAWCVFSVVGTRLPWQPILVDDADSGSLVRQLVFGASAILAIATVSGRRWSRSIQTHFAWVTTLGLLAASVAWSDAPSYTARRSALFACGLALLLCASSSARQSRDGLIRWIPYVVGLLAWLSIAQQAALPATTWSIEERPGLAGVSGHPNNLGQVLSMVWVLALGRTSPPTRWRILQFGIAMALFLTNSVTAILAALAGTVAFWALRTSSYARGAVGLLAAVAASLYASNSSEWKRVAFEFMGREATLSGRADLWTTIWAKAMEAPILGNGFGAFWVEGKGRDLVQTWNPRQSHHAYLDVIVDLGFIGLIVIFVAGVPTLLSAAGTLSRSHTGRRRETAAMLAVAISSLGVGALGESFLLRMDKFAFFLLAWIILTLATERVASCRDTTLARSQRRHEPASPKAQACGTPDARREP